MNVADVGCSKRRVGSDLLEKPSVPLGMRDLQHFDCQSFACFSLECPPNCSLTTGANLIDQPIRPDLTRFL